MARNWLLESAISTTQSRESIGKESTRPILVHEVTENGSNQVWSIRKLLRSLCMRLSPELFKSFCSFPSSVIWKLECLWPQKYHVGQNQERDKEYDEKKERREIGEEES
jgi:hypothetical protein